MQLPFLGEEEFALFVEQLKERLPVTFRVNPNFLYVQNFIDMLEDPEFILKSSKGF